MEERPAKRARQACEPCRRKKSRCPGERPACSYCARLGQNCFYNLPSDGHLPDNGVVRSRIDDLEGKMDHLLQRLSPLINLRQSEPSPTHIPAGEPPLNIPNRQGDVPCDIFQEPDMTHLGLSYLTWCHNQPLFMFNQDKFQESLGTRDRELLLALQALTLRFPPGSMNPGKQEKLASMATEARHVVMNRIADGQVKLSTLQTLCVLSVVDFTDGKTIQSGLNLSIATHLAHSTQPDNALDDIKEWRDCVGSINILNHLQGPIYPTSPLVPDPMGFRGDNHDGQANTELLGFATALAEVWKMARLYAVCNVASDASPPWDPRSDYSRVMQRHLEIDCSIPLKYRFAANRIGEKSLATLQANRDYWGPWLFVHIIYAAIPCLLNHPFLLSMRLRHFRYMMPQDFIRQSFEAISRHAGWILYYLEVLEKTTFRVSDPVLAHCVVVIATIHLQHSFVQETSLRNKAQRGFEKCMGFLSQMASVWPNVSVMCQNLRMLQQSIVVIPSPETSQGRRSFSIDAPLLRNILIYERAGRPLAQGDQSIFNGLLIPNSERHDETDSGPAAKFDLVGSAGISGHKAVPTETPLYPPDENSEAPPARDPSHNVLGSYSSMLELGLPAEAPGVNDPEHLFLQANDFGRAIDDWLNLDSNYSM